MPTKPRREDALIELFVSAYADDTWADAKLDWLDQEHDGAVEVLATRSDGRTLAVEHTLIEFFTGERTDLERFKPFLRIQSDTTLSVPGKWIDVNVPRGVLDGLKPKEQNRIVSGVQNWLRTNIHSLPSGETLQTCHIAATETLPARDVVLQAEVVDDPSHTGSPPLIRRYGQVSVCETVERALTAKLPKLLRTKADRRVLMLARSQMKLNEREIMSEVDKRRTTMKGLASVDVWIAETVFYDTAESEGWRGYVDFKRYVGGAVVEKLRV